MRMGRTRGKSDRRLSTGIAPLDQILRGGLPPYAVVCIAGLPGSGKTTLAQQILFATARAGNSGVYLTTFSESPMKAARYQSGFSFFDASQFGESVTYMDIGQTIRKEGLTAALDVIVDALRELQPTLVVVDSFKAIHDLAPSVQEMRTFIYDLAIELSAMQATTLLVGEYTEEDIAHLPELAIADGIFWLYSELRNDQQLRFLRVLKMRGVNYMTGAYNFTIGKDGLEIFTLDEIKADPDILRGEPIPTGLPTLDALLRGGIPRGTPSLLTGAAGTGKSTLGLQCLYRGAVDRHEPGMYISYEETPEQIVANAARFGWDLRPLIEQGLLRIEYTALTEVNPNEQAQRIQARLQEMGARRAVIDSLTMLLQQFERSDAMRQFVYRLVSIFRNAGCTALLISDPPIGSTAISRFGVEESIIDGVIILRIITGAEERMRQRTLEIYKMRGVAHAMGEHTMTISARGLQIFPRIEEMIR
jgi:circadian clock protein KaiC